MASRRPRTRSGGVLGFVLKKFIARDQRDQYVWLALAVSKKRDKVPLLDVSGEV